MCSGQNWLGIEWKEAAKHVEPMEDELALLLTYHPTRRRDLSLPGPDR